MIKSRKNIARHAARQLACQALYGLSFMDTPDTANAEEALALAGEGQEGGLWSGEELEFARSLATGVCAEISGLDEQIREFSGNRNPYRIGKMEWVMLRLAIYEMNNLRTPPRVVISECLDLADHFGLSASKEFLNGVLHAALKKCDKSSSPPAK